MWNIVVVSRIYFCGVVIRNAVISKISVIPIRYFLKGLCIKFGINFFTECRSVVVLEYPCFVCVRILASIIFFDGLD
jgi:hypothetical protein